MTAMRFQQWRHKPTGAIHGRPEEMGPPDEDWEEVAESPLLKIYTLADVESLALAFADTGERHAGGRLHVQTTMLEFIRWFKAEEGKEG